MKIEDQDKNRAAHMICGTSQSNLDGWLRGDRHSMLFVIPRIWNETQNHINNFCSCSPIWDQVKLVRLSGFDCRNSSTIFKSICNIVEVTISSRIANS